MSEPSPSSPPAPQDSGRGQVALPVGGRAGTSLGCLPPGPVPFRGPHTGTVPRKPMFSRSRKGLETQPTGATRTLPLEANALSVPRKAQVRGTLQSTELGGGIRETGTQGQGPCPRGALTKGTGRKGRSQAGQLSSAGDRGAIQEPRDGWAQMGMDGHCGEAGHLASGPGTCPEAVGGRFPNVSSCPAGRFRPPAAAAVAERAPRPPPPRHAGPAACPAPGMPTSRRPSPARLLVVSGAVPSPAAHPRLAQPRARCRAACASASGFVRV